MPLRSPTRFRAAPVVVAILGLIAPSVTPVSAQVEDHPIAVIVAPRPTVAALAPVAGLGTPVTRAPRSSSSASIRDSASARDSVPASQSRISTNRRSAIVFYSLVAAGTLAAFELRIDPDEGGYEDGWQTKAPFPDKVVHALASFALTSVGVDVGARPWLAATSVCAAGAAFEYSQGYVSYMDISANCIGAAGAALWKSWTKHRDERAER